MSTAIVSTEYCNVCYLKFFILFNAKVVRSRVGRSSGHASGHNPYISACILSQCYDVSLLSVGGKPKEASELWTPVRVPPECHRQSPSSHDINQESTIKILHRCALRMGFIAGDRYPTQIAPATCTGTCETQLEQHQRHSVK